MRGERTCERVSQAQCGAADFKVDSALYSQSLLRGLHVDALGLLGDNIENLQAHSNYIWKCCFAHGQLADHDEKGGSMLC